jgi:hypothetical protein
VFVAALHRFARLPIEVRLQIGREYADHLAVEQQAEVKQAPPTTGANRALARLQAKRGVKGGAST